MSELKEPFKGGGGGGGEGEKRVGMPELFINLELGFRSRCLQLSLYDGVSI